MRTPTDPFGGGAVYHSMSLDGYFSPIPGLVIVMPSTSWDVYGLLMTAADYGGPVICLEPKWMYRQYLGPAFDNEPTDSKEIAKLKREIMYGGVPDIDKDMRVPFSMLYEERKDVTLLLGGVLSDINEGGETLAEQGIDEVIDLRTIVPPDMDTVFESVEQDGCWLQLNRSFAGFVRQFWICC